MIRWIGDNWRTLIWALALSVAVWIAAVTAADPDEQRIYDKPVQLEIVGEDPGMVIVGDYPQQIEVTLRAPRSVWDKIEAQEKPIRAVVDLSGLSAGEHLVRVQAQVNERPVLVVAVSPSTFSINLEPLATRTFPVDLTLNGQPAVGYQAGEATINPKQVIISGAESIVNRVKRARVVVNMNGTRESVNQSTEIQALDENNQPLAGLSVNPETVLVSLPVTQQGGYRDVAVKVVVHGQVASGYLLNKLSVFPPVITVYSTDPALVNALPGVVETEPLDLTGANDDVSTRLALQLPPGVSVVGDQTVQVDVGIQPIRGNTSISKITVDVVGLGEGLQAQVSPAEVDVILSGPAALLDKLTRQTIRVYVDVTGLEAGSHQLTPKVEILVSDVSVESIQPITVEVIISPVGTPTPRGP